MTSSPIEVDQRVVLQFKVTVVDTTDEAGQPITIENVALYDKNMPADPADLDPETPTNEVANPTLLYVKEAVPSDETVREGQVITYRISVTASEDLKNAVTMTDTLPEGIALISGSVKFIDADGAETIESDSVYVDTTRTVTWTARMLKAGTSVYELKAVAEKLEGDTMSLEIKNTAVLKDETGRNWPEAEVSQTVKKRYAEIEKTAALVTVNEENGNETLEDRDPGTEDAPVDTLGGQAVEYVLIVLNHGELVSKEITVTDVVPEGMTYVEDSMTGIGGKVTAARYDEATRTLTWTIDEMGPESELELTFRATAPDEAVILVNQAILTDKELAELTYTEDVTTVDGRHYTTEETVYEEEEITKPPNKTYHQVPPPELEAVKSCDPESGSTVRRGDVITYTITLTNKGGSTANNAIIRDKVPKYTTYVKKSAACSDEGATVKTETINDKKYVVAVIPTLGVGETVTMSFEVKVNYMSQVGTRTIRNVAQTLIPDPEKDLEDEIVNGEFMDTNEVTHVQTRTYSGSGTTSPKTGDNGLAIPGSILAGAVLLLIMMLQSKRSQMRRSKD